MAPFILSPSLLQPCFIALRLKSPAGRGSVWRANSRPAGGWWSVANEAGWGYCVIIRIKKRVSSSLFIHRKLTQNNHKNNDK